MTQGERRLFLIRELLVETPQFTGFDLPKNAPEQRRLLRSLLNLRLPRPIGEDFLAVQDEYLQEEIRRKGITRLEDLVPVRNGLYLWQGDITTLRCDAIVNAANSQLLGCFFPCHGCIDNAIHTYAGIQLRLECAALMERQRRKEETGRAKITAAYNLPCKFVLHTVGPVISGPMTKRDEMRLASCYRSCLKLAEQHRIESIAFCCISTGEFHFPNDKAAEIAVQAVREYQINQNSKIQVIFNVFKNVDYEIYRTLLTANETAESGARYR